MLFYQITCSPVGRGQEKRWHHHLLHGHNRAPVTCLSLGHLHAIALCFCLCSHDHLGGGLGAIVGWGLSLYLVCGWVRWKPPYPAYSGAHLDALEEAWVSPAGASVSRKVVLSRYTSWITPISMCEVPFSLSLQGSDLPLEDSLNFFVCVLINTGEEAAVMFILGKSQNWFIWCYGNSYCFQYTINNQK